MGHQFDDFFKKKMDQRSVDFKEDHWKAMEQLLDDEPNNKRGLYFWLFGLLGLICLTAGTWFIYQNYNSTNDKNNTQKEINISSTNTENSNLPSNKNTTTNEYNNTTTSETNKSGIDQLTNSNNNNNIDSDQATAKAKTNTNNKKGINDFIPTAKEKLNEAKTNVRSNDSQGAGNQLDKSPKATSNIPSINPNTLDVQVSTNSIDDNNSMIDTPLFSNEVPAVEETEDTEIVEEVLASTALEALESLMLLVEGGEERTKIPECPYDSTPKFNFGLSAAFIQVPTFQDKLQLFGTTLGAHVEFKPRKNSLISLNSGVAYTFLKGDFDYTQESQQIEYRFGKEQSAYRLMPRSLHFIEAPLTVKLQLARNAVEAGINVSYLSGVRADVVLDGLFEDAGWIEKAGFNEIRTDLTLGYAWRMNKKWELLFRAQYALKNIVDTEFEPVEGKSYDAVNPLQFRFGLKWNLR